MRPALDIAIVNTKNIIKSTLNLRHKSLLHMEQVVRTSRGHSRKLLVSEDIHPTDLQEAIVLEHCNDWFSW